MLGYDAASDYVRAYPTSKEWLTLLIRRMDAVAAIYRLAAALSPGRDGLRTQVEFFRRGRFDAAITLHDGSSFGIVRQGLALQRRSLYDRLRTIAKYDYTRLPGAILVLTSSKWEERLTARFCIDQSLQDCYVAAESRDVSENRDPRLKCNTAWIASSIFFFLKLQTLARKPSQLPVHGEAPDQRIRVERCRMPVIEWP